MQITLNLKKKLEQSANEYFEKAKKSRKKAEGARDIVLKFQKELAELEKKQQVAAQKESEKKQKAPLQWYEKFRWFISSEGFLCIGGRDATLNEVVIKKHTDKDDIVFHTEAPGSPFFVIKTESKKPSDLTMQEVADAVACFSKAWKIGVSAAEVFAVKPDQVSKQAESGEYMPKGAFMIRGKRNFYQGKMVVAVGKLEDGRVMSGPESAVKTHCKEYAIVLQGRDKPSDCAKKIARKIKADIDEVLRVLPAGTCQVK
jgi:predicted ribosome quality control (RQC) complex YloA/Tae2 family protein